MFLKGHCLLEIPAEICIDKIIWSSQRFVPKLSSRKEVQKWSTIGYDFDNHPIWGINKRGSLCYLHYFFDSFHNKRVKNNNDLAGRINRKAGSRKMGTWTFTVLFYFCIYLKVSITKKWLFFNFFFLKFSLSNLYTQCGLQLMTPRSRVTRSSDWASQAPPFFQVWLFFVWFCFLRLEWRKTKNL